MVKFESVEMSRSIAERLMSVNEHNRHLRPLAIERWKGIYLRGEYDPESGEAIKVRGTLKLPGRLQDGQHRLAGYLEALDEDPSLVVTMIVAQGVRDDAQAVIDTGMKRSLADLLVWRGESNVHLLSSVINLSLKIEKGRLIGTGGLFTYPELLTHFEANEWLRDGVSLGARIVREFRVSPTGCAYAMSAAAHVAGSAAAEDFADHVVHGDNLDRQHPVMRLRDMFIDWTRHRPGAGAGPLAHVVAATTVQAWNVWRRGEVQVPPSWVRWQGGEFPDVE